MSAPRFSKATVRATFDGHIAALAKEHGFDERKGSAQVVGRGEDVNRAYGEFMALCDMRERLELDS